MKVLAIDYSTKSTGWALFSGPDLIDYGRIVPKVKGISRMVYPLKQLLILQDVAEKLNDLVEEKAPHKIVIEEVNQHKNRIAGKSLSGGHFIFLLFLSEKYRKRVVYVDSDGRDGWRGTNGLRLNLSPEQKKENKKRRGKGEKPITKKDLAIAYVNRHYDLNLSIDNKGDDDIADAIGLGHYYITIGKFL